MDFFQDLEDYFIEVLQTHLSYSYDYLAIDYIVLKLLIPSTV